MDVVTRGEEERVGTEANEVRGTGIGLVVLLLVGALAPLVAAVLRVLGVLGVLGAFGVLVVLGVLGVLALLLEEERLLVRIEEP